MKDVVAAVSLEANQALHSIRRRLKNKAWAWRCAVCPLDVDIQEVDEVAWRDWARSAG